MKILVTGGAGYIGSILTPILLTEGHSVTVIDNFMHNQISLLDVIHNANLIVIRGDARDEGLIKQQLAQADIVIPLACLTGAPITNRFPDEAKSVTINGIKLLLKHRSKNQPIIFPTTNSGYGVGQDGIYCTEETPLNPVSLYGRLKVDAEKAILEAGNTITLRLATVFGASPRMRLDLLVNDFVHRAVNDGFIILFEANFKRNYIHIRDVAKAFIHCLKNFDQMKGQPYNVGLSDANLSKAELCEKIKAQLPEFYFTEATIGNDPDKRNYIVSNEKIEKTNYRPDYSLDQGIGELIKAFQILKRNQYANH
jgi:nucleoside-diphosphate-sugar epimerase